MIVLDVEQTREWLAKNPGKPGAVHPPTDAERALFPEFDKSRFAAELAQVALSPDNSAPAIQRLWDAGFVTTNQQGSGECTGAAAMHVCSSVRFADTGALIPFSGRFNYYFKGYIGDGGSSPFTAHGTAIARGCCPRTFFTDDLGTDWAQAILVAPPPEAVAEALKYKLLGGSTVPADADLWKAILADGKGGFTITIGNHELACLQYVTFNGHTYWQAINSYGDRQVLTFGDEILQYAAAYRNVDTGGVALPPPPPPPPTPPPPTGGNVPLLTEIASTVQEALASGRLTQVQIDTIKMDAAQLVAGVVAPPPPSPIPSDLPGQRAYLLALPTDADFIAQAYTVLLKRQGDAGGVAYWLGQVQSKSRNYVLDAFISSAEYKAAHP